MSYYLYFALFAVFCLVVRAEEGSANTTEITGRSGSYGFPENFENSRPATNFPDRFYNSDGLYPEFSDRRDRYDNEKPLPYEIPSGFDQFVPDKNNDAKYTYGPGGFYLPYPPNFRPDYTTKEDENKNKVTKSPSISMMTGSPKFKDLIFKAMRYLIGNNDPDSILFDERPSLLSGLKQLFKDPLVALTAVIVPLSFLLSTVIPFLTKILMKTSILPAVTSTIANTVARSLENPVTEKMLDIINEYGARAINDPRCVQRFVCQAAKAHIESRSGDSWSAQKIIRKLAKDVDDKLWNALGIKTFFNSVQNGHCENLPCNEGIPYASDKPLMDKLRMALSKLFNYTVTEAL